MRFGCILYASIALHIRVDRRRMQGSSDYVQGTPLDRLFGSELDGEEPQSEDAAVQIGSVHSVRQLLWDVHSGQVTPHDYTSGLCFMLRFTARAAWHEAAVRLRTRHMAGQPGSCP